MNEDLLLYSFDGYSYLILLVLDFFIQLFPRLSAKLAKIFKDFIISFLLFIFIRIISSLFPNYFIKFFSSIFKDEKVELFIL